MNKHNSLKILGISIILFIAVFSFSTFGKNLASTNSDSRIETNKESLEELNQFLSVCMQILDIDPNQKYTANVNEKSLEIFNELSKDEDITYGEMLDQVFPNFVQQLSKDEEMRNKLELLHHATISPNTNGAGPQNTTVFHKELDPGSN